MKISTISYLLFSIPFIPDTNKPVSITNQLALAVRIYVYQSRIYNSFYARINYASPFKSDDRIDDRNALETNYIKRVNCFIHSLETMKQYENTDLSYGWRNSMSLCVKWNRYWWNGTVSKNGDSESQSLAKCKKLDKQHSGNCDNSLIGFRFLSRMIDDGFEQTTSSTSASLVRRLFDVSCIIRNEWIRYRFIYTNFHLKKL